MSSRGVNDLGFVDGDVVLDTRDDKEQRGSYRFRIGGKWVWPDGSLTGGTDRDYAKGFVEGTCRRIL